jgi:nucleotide-binding universal stress UspA family protein
MYKFKRILVPLDGSELAEAALDPALAIAESMGAEVVLF